MSSGSATSATVPVWEAMREKLRRAQQMESIPRRADSDRIPLSSAQERLWFLCQANPGTAAYNIPFAWRLRGDLSINALHRALGMLTRRHVVFQTAFARVDGRPYQHHVASPDIELALIDCSAAPAVSRFAAVMERAGVEAAKPFALDTAPLFRATVFKLSPRDHVLVLVFHHLIFDGWSRQIFLKELKLLYASVLTGAPARLPELNLQYADFAAWESSRGDRDEAQIEAWKQELAGPLPTLDLPLDRARPATRSLGGDAIPFRLTRGIFQAMEGLRASEESTRFVVLLAGMAALLHRWTGQEDLIIGTASANRGQPELRNMIGFFVNTLPIRFAVTRHMTFRDLVRSGQEKLLHALEREEVPFSKIVEAVNPARTQSNSPLFDAMFVLQNASRDELNLPGLKCIPVRVHNGTSKFDFTFELTERAGGIAGSIEYSTEIFCRPTMRWFSRYYQSLLGAAVARPDCPLHRLPITTERDRRLARLWNSCAASYPSRETVHCLFERRVQAAPAAIAVEHGKELWSYRELDNAANALAATMAGRGIKEHDRVAICAERSPALIVAMLAILKLGAAYVPIDPAYPRERMRFMQQDCSSPLLLVDARNRASAAAFGPVLELDAFCRREQVGAVPCPVSPAASGDAAYVLYTSGSTGSPKGVCVPHRAIARLVLNTNYITIRPGDRVAQAASSSFDAATFEIWGALLNGARVVILPRDVVLSPAALGAELAQRKVSILFLTTALFNVLVRERPNALQTVSTVLFGGEAADPVAARIARDALPRTRLLNVYGPTETTTFATWFDIADLPRESATVPIGLPISNTDVHVLDEKGELAPIGVRGEIHIGGDGLASGYLNQPELTAKRFITAEAHMPGGVSKRRLYRTGDFGRRLPDGNIEFLGRLDKQVKIRGHRIELSEIETVLAGHPAVSACAVVVDEAGGDKKLAAFAQASRRVPATPRQLKEWMAGKLPDYMVPASITMVETLPLTANGKLDRASLPGNPGYGSEIVELKPWIPLQVQLAEIWRELLGREKVGLRDSFFDLGGHSLLAMQLIDRIEQACGVSLPVSALFAATTIEQLSEKILRQQFGAATPLIEVQPGGARSPIFFLHGDLLGGGLYCLPVARQLGCDQPFFALPPSRLSGPEIPTITELAAAHLRVVRARMPEGPYVLGGFCISGLIALEMARALQQDGEEVPLVILADPPPPRFLRFARWCVESGSRMRKGPLERQLDELMTFHNRLFRLREFLKSSTAAKVRAAKHRLTRRAHVAPQEDGGTESRLFSAYLWTAAGHRPKRYHGRTALFCCDGVMAPAVKKLRAWSALLPNATMHVVGGEHLDLVTSRSSEMTRVLRAILPDSPVGLGTSRA